jgi:histidyl-tRNA synthetase
MKRRPPNGQVDAWDEDGFRIVRAGLTRLHPAQASFVLNSLGPSVGIGAVVGVKTLLDRLDALEKSPERKATRKEDHAALATLSARGITARERARLADLVQTAQSTTEIEAPDEAGKAAREEAYVKALGALRVWYVDWSDMARSVIKRRDYLIRLGLAKRKSTKKPKS